MKVNGNRVLDMKNMKKKGEYIIERYYAEKQSGKTNVSLTKENREKHVSVIGICPRCGSMYFSVCDEMEKTNEDGTKTRAFANKQLECPNAKCKLELELEDCKVFYDKEEAAKEIIEELKPEPIQQEETTVEPVQETIGATK